MICLIYACYFLFVLFDLFDLRVKKGFKCNLRLYGMKRYLRTVTKRNDRVFSHTLSIPVDIVKKLELSENIVELKIKDGSIVIKKLAES